MRCFSVSVHRRRAAVALAALSALALPAAAVSDHLPRPVLGGLAEVGEQKRASLPGGGKPDSWRWYRCDAEDEDDCERIEGEDGRSYRCLLYTSDAADE